MNKFNIKNVYLKMVGKSFQSHYNQINDLKGYEEVMKFQDERLKDLLLHCLHHSPYYREIFKNIGMDDAINDGDSAIISELFNRIPILDKDIIRTNLDDIVSDDHEKRYSFYNTSGGSTGEPVRFLQDRQYTLWGNATNFYYYKNILDVNGFSAKKIILWGSERDLFARHRNFKEKFANWVNNTRFLNTFKMNADDMDRYIKTMNSFKAELIKGYASSLYEFCKYIDEKQENIHSPRFVISTAEPLRNDMREVIEKVMGTKVYNFYGSREISNLAGECQEGSMHYFPFWNKYEILDENNNPVKNGKEGKIVLTNLFNYSMPMVRYEIGDIGAFGNKKCACDNILPTLKSVSGRLYENFVKKDGTLIYGHYFTYQFYFKDWVKKFQFIQEDYDRIRIVAVLNREVNVAEQKEIERKIRLLMGQSCQIIWEFVDEIPTTKSGKYIWVKSLIK